MSMDMTWLDFQLSSDHQNVRQFYFFDCFISNSHQGLNTWYMFSGSASLLALSISHVRPKRSYVWGQSA